MIYRCPVKDCSRKLASFEMEGDDLVVTELDRGHVYWEATVTGEAELRVDCHRHYIRGGWHEKDLWHEYRCTNVRVVHEREAGTT